jgi:hypothetical protein
MVLVLCIHTGGGSTGTGKGASLMPPPSTGAGTRGAASAGGNGNLTTAQAAAQMALCNGSGQMNGLVPVRTGLAWATLGELPVLELSRRQPQAIIVSNSLSPTLWISASKLGFSTLSHRARV